MVWSCWTSRYVITFNQLSARSWSRSSKCSSRKNAAILMACAPYFPTRTVAISATSCSEIVRFSEIWDDGLLLLVKIHLTKLLWPWKTAPLLWTIRTPKTATDFAHLQDLNTRLFSFSQFGKGVLIKILSIFWFYSALVFSHGHSLSGTSRIHRPTRYGACKTLYCAFH